MNSYKKYIQYLILSLILTTIGSGIGTLLPKSYIVLYAILSIALLIVFYFSSGESKKIIFYIFTIGEGAILSPLLSRYTTASLLGCLFLTTLIVCIFTIIGLKAKDLGFLGGILFMALLVIVIYGLISIFIPLPSIAIIVVGVFCLYVSYDINQFKIKVQNYGDNLSDDEILESVMDMYLDIINILINLLEILGDSDD